MFCQFCGTPIPAGGAACPKCGGPALVAAAPAGQPGPFAPQPGGFVPYTPPPRSSSFPWVLVGAIGCLGLIVVAGIGAAVVLPMRSSLEAARVSSRTTDCKNHLKQLGVYVHLYESKNRKYPPDLRSLWKPDLATDPDIFTCPVASGKTDRSTSASPGRPWESFSSRVSYDYRFPERGDATALDALMAWDRAPHPNGKRCVLYFMGRVDEVDQATFERLFNAK